MTVLFIDSDILLDIILNRAPFYSSSAKILALTDDPGFICCTTVHTLLNVHYVTKRQLDAKTANKAVELLVGKLRIISEGKELIEQALASSFSDFEDAVQHFAALSAKASYIITRNIKDYKNSTIPVLTAEQFLRTII
ncbi:PIN domain-containing protein [Mucilaginibacter myungsuensis]|uniref:PIN domain-containing protein n=1 Tax=Mucilaginibacter myungsuensis TaxID=649104 RepID=A0A929PUT4_9SPHI|nr:PIN domain-containing protein [Mucilaginibacter myungsuensis]MBE9661098.1 PIN domain-containing protein [Mucilaginibacter myungsuensis]MDN3597242.1 PIN domain-containing protein [Mucilaginibacter myungsuensis]